MELLDSGGGGGAAAGVGGAKSSARFETVVGSHEFTVYGFSLAKGVGVGKYISSDVFTVAGVDWAIYFFPDGKNREDSTIYVSAFIALVSEVSADVRALFELTLLDQSGKDKHKVLGHFDRPMLYGPYTLSRRGSMWGYKRFFKRETLEQSDYMKNDTLAFICKVGVVISTSPIGGPNLPSSVDPNHYHQNSRNQDRPSADITDTSSDSSGVENVQQNMQDTQLERKQQSPCEV